MTLLLHALLLSAFSVGQSYTPTSEVLTVYSQNGRFYFRSVPTAYGGTALGHRGRTTVFESGGERPLYVVDRSFEALDFNNWVFLSNDGEVILQVLGFGADESRPDERSLTVYKRGQLLASYTAADVTHCDMNKERCGIFYSNYDRVIERLSETGQRVFKPDVDDRERFLSNFPVFSSDDTVYITDSKKVVHEFDLRNGREARTDEFDRVFGELKGRARANRVTRKPFPVQIFPPLPKLIGGQDTHRRLAKQLGMKTVDLDNGGWNQPFRIHYIRIKGDVFRDGHFKVESLEIHGDVSRERVLQFFAEQRFQTRVIPEPCDRWYFERSLLFRKSDDRLARMEKEQQLEEEQKELARRVTLESINGVYIPKDLGDCFLELDKRLPEIDRKEMQALPKRDDMILYHFGLGMWMRNTWGLWGGSRLQRYFTDLGVSEPDTMSGIILYYYYDWLHNDREGWKTWQTTWRQRQPMPAAPPPPPKKK